MVRDYDAAGVVHRTARRLAATRPASWLLARAMPAADRVVLRLSRGRGTLTGVVTALPVVLLTTTGARTGTARRVPVMGFGVDAGIAVTAGNFGAAHAPAWCHNLRAQPRARLAAGGGREWVVVAREPDGEERRRIWDQGLAIHPGAADYERRSGRAVAVFVLEPDVPRPDPNGGAG